MAPLEIAFIISAAICPAAALTPTAVRKAVTATALTLFAAATAAVVIAQGPRWQFSGVLLAGVLGTGLAISRATRGRTKSLVLVPAVGALAVGALSLWAFQPLNLPDPGGEYPTGTMTTYWTDQTRPETATKNPMDKRNITAQIWYPAASAATRAGYLGSTKHEEKLVTEGLSTLLGVPSFLLSEAVRGHGNATPNTPLAAGSNNYGVVLFSPGLLGVRTQNTAWAEFLAARGYVVVALDHPYDSAMTVTQSGEPIRSKVGATGNDETDDAATNTQVRIRAADLSFALDQLTALPFFKNRLDLDKVAVTGHSAGGAAALQAAAQDDRFGAVIDIDGLPRNGARPSQPVLAFTAGDGTGNEANDAKYQQELTEVLDASTEGHLIDVPHTKHLSFTDAPFLLPRLPMLFGSASPEQAYAAITTPSLDFLRTAFTSDAQAPADADAVPR